MSSGRSESFTFDIKSDARRTDSFGSESSFSDKDAPKSTRGSWLKRHRTRGSFSSDASSKPYNSPTVNCYTHCGRHTDQFLFGGHSLMDLFRRRN